MRTTSVGLGVVIVGVVGCVGGTAVGPMTIDEMPAKVQAAECRVLVTCGSFPDQTSCEQALPVEALAQPVVDAVNRGTMTFDGTLANECLSHLGVDCSTPDPPACWDMFQGRVAPGGACVIEGECAGDGRCVKPQGCTDACCAGTCGPAKVALGGDCSRDVSLCPRGSFCEGGTCVADLPVGASCAGGKECAEPAVCNFVAQSPQSSICVLPAATGAACDPSRYTACARTDDYCDAGTQTCTRRHPPGAACSATNACVGYAFCQDGTCVARLAVGAACDETADVDRCLPGLDCIDGACAVALKPLVCG